ncbi:ATP-grasp domain-containing protein [Myxococcus sp. CA051A]|uniref:D-alanine--D-alanine ligase family protein n=1 Tax=unclassified Myxococcus TaxID=2648731 RepID=UPI00157A9A89|nr:MULTISPECIES: ATP-grasp domain-containing protein [unclassified Myxococcus]NTX13891.1 ATP-grasp domain-containing protein [Myxococcus sp. CA056]NTX36855.1 ATP-grasp domain-containing protein [Myxococcus sp. CA033]NTX51057.1 ATP-grasp domain-containing protein [Myxococcus sp. CA039A]NTX62507.1 ATP-grasp domain-containing protein [Myxococcus sp. CA051A]
MAPGPWRIAVLHYQPKGEPADAVMGQVRSALEEGGHETVAIGVDESVSDLVRMVGRSRADLVFNICETFADDYRLEVNVAAMLELARVPFTGSGTAGLLLAQDKILTKQLLQYHGVLTPRFATFDGASLQTSGDLRFPVVVKPARSDASLGLGVEKDLEGLARRVRKIREEFGDEALAEEFIEGRELYVGVLGDPSRPEVLPVVELDFGAKWGRKRMKIANREVKFGPETAGSPRLVLPTDLSDELLGRVSRAAITAFRALKLRDYARIDFRLSSGTKDPYLLEVNPNPYLEAQCEVALGARERGLSYPALIRHIADTAMQRQVSPRMKAVPVTEAQSVPRV